MAEGTDPKTDPTGIDPAADPGDGTDWKAMARKWEKLAKENSGAAKKLSEIEEANKSELEKALEAKKSAEDKLAQMETAAELAKTRARVSEKTGVPAEFIVGDDEESMTEYATKLSKHYRPDPAPKKSGAGRFASNASDEDAAKREFARQLFGKDE